MKGPNHDVILAYAKRRGLVDARIKDGVPFGWELCGKGREIRKDETEGFPLVWAVAEECGISWGCGSSNFHQIKPELFKEPTTTE